MNHRVGIRVSGARVSACLAFVVCTTAGVALAGDLTPPPGPIAATNRTILSQPTTPLPFTITQSGSYFLTSNLTGVNGQNGITIAADDVTLDLNGFTLQGVAGSLDGVLVSGAHSNITVTNGIISDWGGSGINAGSCTNCRFENLSISSSGTDGLTVGSDSLVRGLSVSGSGAAAIRVAGDRNRIDSCHIVGSGTGIKVDGTQCLVVRNSAAGNVTDYDIGAGNAYGPIADVGGVGDISIIPEALHPWANFGLTCTPTTEVCDGVDNNCNGQIDEGVLLTWCEDIDGDMFGDPNSTIQSCNQEPNFVSDCTDCNDGDPNTNPGATEVCDGADNNCNGDTDEGCGAPNGSSCNSNGDCMSGICAELSTICCDTACLGLCESCSLQGSEGTCTLIPAGQDPQNECAGGLVCDGGGNCVCQTDSNCLTGQSCCGGSCIDTQNDDNNCGSCGNVCGGGESCCNGTCINTSSDPNNCGSCGTVCPTAPNATPNCSASSCSLICDSGFEDCNFNSVDGCEINTDSDVNNCGACGFACPLNNSCVAASCCKNAGELCAVNNECCSLNCSGSTCQ